MKPRGSSVKPRLVAKPRQAGKPATTHGGARVRDSQRRKAGSDSRLSTRRPRPASRQRQSQHQRQSAARLSSGVAARAATPPVTGAQSVKAVAPRTRCPAAASTASATGTGQQQQQERCPAQECCSHCCRRSSCVSHWGVSRASAVPILKPQGSPPSRGAHSNSSIFANSSTSASASSTSGAGGRGQASSHCSCSPLARCWGAGATTYSCAAGCTHAGRRCASC